jgi:signal peptidase II
MPDAGMPDAGSPPFGPPLAATPASHATQSTLAVSDLTGEIEPAVATASQPAASLNRTLRLTLVVCVLLCAVGCDQVAKTLAQASLATSPPVSLLHDCVRFELAQNRGAFLSVGETLPGSTRYLLFVVLVSGALTLTLIFTLRLRAASPVQLVALSLLTGGGLGNLIDRLLHDGAVVDFISVGVGPLRTGIFNVADAAITLGVLLLLIPWRQSSIFTSL